MRVRIIPFFILTLLGIASRIYLELKNVTWILGGSGPSLEDLVPGYILFFLSAVILSIVMAKKFSSRQMKAVILVFWLTIACFTMIDIGKDVYYKADDYYANIKVNRLKDYYSRMNGPQLTEVIWYTQKQTVYLFQKNGEVSEKDIYDIVKSIKPVDNLDITIELLSSEQKRQLIYRFSNSKKLINKQNDKMLERMSEHYYYDQ